MKFTKKLRTTKTVNRAGGAAYVQSDKMQLVSLLLTSFVQDQYYRSEKDTMKEVRDIVAGLPDKKFAAQAAIYARNEFGMRSISHVVAAELAPYASTNEWGKNFYNKVIHRVDDMLEIASCFFANSGKNVLTNAMKKGFRQAFNRFTEYHFAKYRGEGKEYSLIDLVNSIRPIPTDKNKEGLQKLVAGTLRTTQTWESKVSAAGQQAENDEDKVVKKAAAWKEMLTENKLGYIALLRNVRNIYEADKTLINDLCIALCNRDAIKKSLVFPFQIATCAQEVAKMGVSSEGRLLLKALEDAIEISLDNVPKFAGRTAVILDVSGSMRGKPTEIGSLFAAVLARSNNADLYAFSDNCCPINYALSAPVMALANELSRIGGGGTNFRAIFPALTHSYDRVIILSDMQGWVGYETPKAEFSAYKSKHGSTPFVYSFDLQGYGTLQFPEQNVFSVAGFSDKVFDVMKLLEEDREALIRKIEAIKI